MKMKMKKKHLPIIRSQNAERTILYFRTVIYYDIISLLSLASSCLTLTVHIIGRFYQAVNPVVKPRNRLSVSTDDPSKTGGPHPLQFNPEHDISDREIKEIKSLDQEKVGGDGDKGKGRVPEVVVDSQNVGDDEKPNKRSSVGSNFQEMFS
ncbi:hypothetical protein C1645_736560 [Glomus cerebriforme]|uniref:Uncharacterized protein n=1 Tax=Glomus cerebriforme TaxID=658196 RepID=A0A397T5G1_9GLOM|nr:hypothetical protein C1645_736560 [Glomus cerebriforme]